MRGLDSGQGLTAVKKGEPPCIPTRRLIREFYAAFARRDAEAMARCYHDEVFFSDPAFPKLRGRGGARHVADAASPAPRTSRSSSTRRAPTPRADGARWTARYTFSRTGRKVVNRIDALFAFRDGRIVRHYDRFSVLALVVAGAGAARAAPGLVRAR